LRLVLAFFYLAALGVFPWRLTRVHEVLFVSGTGALRHVIFTFAGGMLGHRFSP